MKMEIFYIATLFLLIGFSPNIVAQSNSQKYINSLFANENTLKEVAKSKTTSTLLNPSRPAVTSASSLTTRAGLWGEPDNITISMLKTDIIDRRYIDKNHYTMADIIEGAYSEANRDLNDMPMAGMTRPSFASLDKRGGRYNHGLWSELYPFPCQKPVGQVIIKAPDFKGASQPEAIQHLKNGEITIQMEKDGKKLNL